MFCGNLRLRGILQIIQENLGHTRREQSATALQSPIVYFFLTSVQQGSWVSIVITRSNVTLRKILIYSRFML
jgi:hypothetical protein